MVDGVIPVGVVVGRVAYTASGVATEVFVSFVGGTSVRIIRSTADATTTTSPGSARKGLVDNFHSFHLLPLLLLKQQLDGNQLLSQPLDN